MSPSFSLSSTSVLILLYFLTPRSELSSNITAPALFRYIEECKAEASLDEPTVS